MSESRTTVWSCVKNYKIQNLQIGSGKIAKLSENEFNEEVKKCVKLLMSIVHRDVKNAQRFSLSNHENQAILFESSWIL